MKAFLSGTIAMIAIAILAAVVLGSMDVSVGQSLAGMDVRL
ncbi:MAG: hypothetical protein V3T80_09190 [Kiloniellales bacterium]|jgi:hypothetical protein